MEHLRAAAMVPFGLASVRLPVEMKALIRQLLGLAPDDRLPLAVECDDVHLLKHAALSTDTVLASTDACVREEVKAGLLRPLPLRGMPPLHSEMGIVSLKGRTFSPMAEFAVRFLREKSA
ncbi:MAG: LysR substrate-binding domain-containing protein [Ramlibacter sp.]